MGQFLQDLHIRYLEQLFRESFISFLNFKCCSFDYSMINQYFKDLESLYRFDILNFNLHWYGVNSFQHTGLLAILSPQPTIVSIV